MLAKNAKAFAKRVKKSFMIGCDVLRISAFKIFQHRDTEIQRKIVKGNIIWNIIWQLYVDPLRRDDQKNTSLWKKEEKHFWMTFGKR